MTRFCAGGSNINASGSVSVSARTAATSSWENGEAMGFDIVDVVLYTVHHHEFRECHAEYPRTSNSST